MPEEKPEAPADQLDDDGKEEEVRPQTAIMGVPDFGDDDDDDGPPAAGADTQQTARPDFEG